jgi:hypothetical protein
MWRFHEQAQAFKQLLITAAPDAERQMDLDFLLNVGHMFSLIVYRLSTGSASSSSRADEFGRRHRRSDLRFPDLRPLHVCRCAVGQTELHTGAAGWGGVSHPQASARRRALQPGRGRRQGVRRRLRAAAPDADVSARCAGRSTRSFPDSNPPVIARLVRNAPSSVAFSFGSERAQKSWPTMFVGCRASISTHADARGATPRPSALPAITMIAALSLTSRRAAAGGRTGDPTKPCSLAIGTAGSANTRLPEWTNSSPISVLPNRTGSTAHSRIM